MINFSFCLCGTQVWAWFTASPVRPWDPTWKYSWMTHGPRTNLGHITPQRWAMGHDPTGMNRGWSHLLRANSDPFSTKNYPIHQQRWLQTVQETIAFPLKNWKHHVYFPVKPTHFPISSKIFPDVAPENHGFSKPVAATTRGGRGAARPLRPAPRSGGGRSRWQCAPPLLRQGKRRMFTRKKWQMGGFWTRKMVM